MSVVLARQPRAHDNVFYLYARIASTGDVERCEFPVVCAPLFDFTNRCEITSLHVWFKRYWQYLYVGQSITIII